MKESFTMGFFDFLKKSAEPDAPAAPAFPVTLAADAKGTVVAMENIPDEVFAQGILGKCCGIDPTEGKIYAPADGEITQAPDSGHALGISKILMFASTVPRAIIRAHSTRVRVL